MATEIPTGFKFNHLLAHTFPGFFLSITLFMALDILSPIDLTSFITGSKGIEGLVAFAGFVLLVGSILGVIIDGIHHFLIRCIFKGDSEVKALEKERDHLLSSYCSIINKETDICRRCLEGKPAKYGDKPKCIYYDSKETQVGDENEECYTKKYSLNKHYLFKELSDKFIPLNDYAIDGFYSYFEFHSNTFIALFFFSFIAPIYAYSVLEIYSLGFFFWNIPNSALAISILSCIVASFCIFNSYSVYVDYLKVLNAAYRGYIDPLRKKTAKGTYTIKGEAALEEKARGVPEIKYLLNGEVELGGK